MSIGALRKQQFKVGRAALTSLMVVLFLGIAMAAACPAIHHRLHHDFLDADHHCVIAQWGHDGLLAGVTTVTISLSPSVCYAITGDTGCAGVPSPDHRNPPCRAPPLA